MKLRLGETNHILTSSYWIGQDSNLSLPDFESYHLKSLYVGHLGGSVS